MQCAQPTDSISAVAALNAAMMYQDKPAFFQAAQWAEQHLSDNLETMQLLGEGFTYFAMPQQAVTAFGAALAIEDRLDVREQLGYAMLLQSDPDGAMPWLDHIFTHRMAEEVGLLYNAVSVYQSLGRHEDALQVLARMEETFPDSKNKKNIKWFRKRSTKHLHSDHKLPSPITVSDDVRPQGLQTIRWRMATWMGPVVATVLLIAYLLIAYMLGQERDVYLLNGTRRSYEITLNGVNYVLPPLSTQRIEVPEGDLTLQFVNSIAPIDDVQIEISTPFFVRPFLNRTFIVNPDRSGVVLWEEAIYSSSAPAGQDSYELHCGKVLHQFKGIDYDFQPFPNSVSVSKRSSSARKQRIDHLRDWTIRDRIDLVADQHGMELATEVAVLMARLGDESESVWNHLETSLSDDQLLAFLQPGLTHRPFLLCWHRANQNLQERLQNGNIKQEYVALRASDPSNPVLRYLAARLEDDPEIQEQEFLQAIAAGLTSERPLHWLVYATFSTARFEKALEYSDKLASFDVEDEHYHHHQIEALAALKRYDVALDANTQFRQRQPSNGRLVAEQLMLMKLAGRCTEEQAEGIIEDFCRVIAQRIDSAAANSWKRYLKRYWSYLNGDFEAFASNANDFAAFVTANDFDRALDTLDNTEGVGFDDWLILNIAAATTGRKEIADASMQKAIEILNSAGRQDLRGLTNWLTSENPPDVVAVCNERLPRIQKMAVLVALGLRHQEDAAAYFALAQKLNCLPQFPSNILQNAMNSRSDL